MPFWKKCSFREDWNGNVITCTGNEKKKSKNGMKNEFLSVLYAFSNWHI